MCNEILELVSNDISIHHAAFLWADCLHLLASSQFGLQEAHLAEISLKEAIKLR